MTASTGMQLPARLEVYVEELPETSQDWLRDEAMKPHLFHVRRRGRFSDVLVALFFTALWAAVALVSVVNESGWPGFLAALYGVAALLATAPMVWAWRELAWSFAVPHRRMVSVHPRYLLEVGVEKVVAWPVANFDHGVASGGSVTLQFGSKKVTLAMRSHDLAEKLTQTLTACKGSASLGEPDFIPLPFFEVKFRSKVKAAKRAAQARRWLYCAGLAAVLAVAAAQVGTVRERERVWAGAVNSGSVSELAKVLEQRPEGDGSERFDAFRKAQLSAARQSLEATLEKTDPRLLALNRVLLSVQKANHPRLSLRPRPMPLEGSTGAQASAFSDSELKAALARFPQRLYDGFSDAMTRRAREVLAVTPGSAERGVTVEVTLTPRLLEKSVQVGRMRWPLLGLSAVTVLDGQPLSTAAVELDDGDCTMLSSADSAGEVLDAQMQRLLWKMGGALARSFGLAVEP